MTNILHYKCQTSSHYSSVSQICLQPLGFQICWKLRLETLNYIQEQRWRPQRVSSGISVWIPRALFVSMEKSTKGVSAEMCSSFEDMRGACTSAGPDQVKAAVAWNIKMDINIKKRMKATASDSALRRVLQLSEENRPSTTKSMLDWLIYRPSLSSCDVNLNVDQLNHCLHDSLQHISNMIMVRQRHSSSSSSQDRNMNTTTAGCAPRKWSLIKDQRKITDQWSKISDQW